MADLSISSRANLYGQYQHEYGQYQQLGSNIGIGIPGGCLDIKPPPSPQPQENKVQDDPNLLLLLEEE